MSASTHHTGTPLSAVLRIFGTGRGQNPPDIESTKPPTKRSSKRAQRKEQKLAKAQEEKIMKTEIQDCIVEQLSDYPTGYPQQAAFQSDLSFSVYRGFGYLHARILLQLQDELRVLETDLRDMDELDDNGTNKRVLSSRMKDETRARKAGKLMSDRAILLETIHDKLAKYDDFLLKTREINALEKPSDRDYISMRTWFCNMKPFSYQPEEEFIKRKRDLVTLRPNTEWGHFDEWIEEGIERLPTRIGRGLFSGKQSRPGDRNLGVYHYLPSTITKTTTMVMTLIVLVLLIIPIITLYQVTSAGKSTATIEAMGILVAFIFLFSVTMGLLTGAKRQELFAASAAHAAVLVVFLGNLGNVGNRK
ncbi:hypothetical protein HBI88_144920 [Parastagonospora nodorum]|nr:hypothetical protein HBI46_186410 [Parastagonospora nodorum]KAH5770096.1 hypothetical protein HBI97_158600 [Parastagonospora nodorum]KAH5799354.1 hypothetical protein HBI96_159110 [Parastagonospora nodorum]KAH5814970.1 hypothetical protein HBI94_133650 [Parastagonospora nodorum]KAH5828987.1 hypothetical protein HBI93_138680 [Parastagonospora nodorum]